MSRPELLSLIKARLQQASPDAVLKELIQHGLGEKEASELIAAASVNRRAAAVDQKKRHGCLTAWLFFLIFTNSIQVVQLFRVGDAVAAARDLPTWTIPVLTISVFSKWFWLVGLLQLRRVAFWGFVTTWVLILSINVHIGNGPFALGNAVLEIGLLYALLLMGRPRTGWSQLD